MARRRRPLVGPQRGSALWMSLWPVRGVRLPGAPRPARSGTGLDDGFVWGLVD